MNEWWLRNLHALEDRPEPWMRELATALKRAGFLDGPPPTDRQGQPLPWIDLPTGRRALRSQFDRVREAQRWSVDLSSPTLLVWGTPSPEALRSRGTEQKLLCVEPAVEAWQSVFALEDWTDLLARPNVHLFMTPAHRWREVLLACYRPVWDGALRSCDWRASVEARDVWASYIEQTRRALEESAGDLSTQARFAERWYRNALVNLSELRDVEGPMVRHREVTIAGAGPSLDDEPVPDTLLFAADTALPALTARGRVPDVVFCLDGQLPSYHHFVAPLPPTLIVADLTSLPLLSRRGVPVLRFLTAHPLATVIRRTFPEIPVLDGSSGNVSGLAAQTAWDLGARSVTLVGVDLAYRRGQAYARGAYPETLALRGSSRLSPVESQLGSRCYGLAETQSFVERGQTWTTTPLLRSYRERFPTGPRQRLDRLVNAASGSRADQWLTEWKRRLERLPLPDNTADSAFWSTLAPDVIEDWQAIWPIAAVVARKGVSLRDRAAVTRERALAWFQH